jgi:hypothetical protein
VVLGAVLFACPSARVQAFSDPFSYGDTVQNGGGDGRWFTGSPADGFACDACHEGAPGVDLSVNGLPMDGFVPGTSYEVSVLWPPQVQHLALIAEFSDELRQGAGTIVLPRPDVTGELERCSGEQQGFPSSEVHEAEAGRTLVSVVDCGARMLRFLWTAPDQVQGRVWFNLGFVVSDDNAAPDGDGVTLVAAPLSVMGAAAPTRMVAQGCSVAAPRSSARAFTPLWLLALAWGLRRRVGVRGEVR